MMRILFVVTIFFTGLIANAQSNKLALINPVAKATEVKVVVLDEENAMEPLAFANVIIKEKGQEKATDLKGECITRLRPGSYNFEIQFVGYASKVLSDIKVLSGKPLVLRTSLKALQLEPSANFDALFSDKSEN